MMKEKLIVYSDGASRGNPGKSAIAFTILDENGNTLKSYSKYVGIKTNNQAEYEALIIALEFASELGGKIVSSFMDSELVVKQLNMEYKVKNLALEVLWLKVCKLKQNFKRISFTHVSRENKNIKEVDDMVNQALNEAGDIRHF